MRSLYLKGGSEERYMSDKESHDKTARALRVYEYTNREGVVFYSFTYLPGSTIHRLQLEDVRGVHFRRHITDIHQLAFQAEVLTQED